MLASKEIMVRKVVECQCTIRINFECSFHFLHSSANPTSYKEVATVELEQRVEGQHSDCNLLLVQRHTFICLQVHDCYCH
jgi:hypothetical protein